MATFLHSFPQEGFVIENATEISQVCELFRELKETAFVGVPERAVSVLFPEYLPPVVAGHGVKTWIGLAASAIQKCVDTLDTVFLSAYYEDHCDPEDCCVVFAVQLQRPGKQNGFMVENSWLEEVGIIAHNLLAQSVDLTLSSGSGCLNFDFRVPVHYPGAKGVRHQDTIMLVEDDVFVRAAAREVLEMAGYRVLDTATADEALAIFAQHRRSIGLVISDVTMPGRDGRALATALHKHDLRLPVLLISGYPNLAMEDPLQESNWLAKPFNTISLLGAVERSLRSRPQVSPMAVKEQHERVSAIDFC